jgi:serine/threonine protein kinase
MSAPATAEEFLELLSKSGVLAPENLQAYVLERRLTSSLPEKPRELADALVYDGLVTRFQAEQLLLGKYRNFHLAGKYKILERLGSGGMGSVFLCEHQVMRRRVAVKVLPRQHAGDPAARERFYREARAVANLHHPNIVGAYDIDRDGDLHFLVMEYIDGSSLDKLVRLRGPMDPVRAAHYVRQAALGLQHAHEAGLIHRDVKPSNLLVDRTGTVKVLDMGLALFFREESDDLTRKQAPGAMGTADYMAPEQALDSHAVDVRADVYSLGATFYFLLRGRSPFQRSGAGRQKARPANQLPPPLTEFRADVPEGLVRVIDRMLAPDPAQRYQSAAEVAEALLPWVTTPIPLPAEEEMPRLSRAAGGNGSAGEGQGPPTPPSSTASTVAQSKRPAGMTPTPLRGEPLPGPPSDGSRASAGTGRRHAAVAGMVAAVLVIGGLCFAVYRAATQPEKEAGAGHTTPRLRILVPAYFYPGGKGLRQWDRLIDSAGAVGLVAVVNPQSGPGEEFNPSYAEVIDRAKAAGITMIGYVSTGHTKRPLLAVKADVDRWVRFYPRIDGIFFDEQASEANRVTYYASLYDHMRQVLPMGLVVTNPGTVCAEEYLSRPATDVGCLAEASRSLVDYRVPVWADRYPANRFCALIEGVVSRDKMREYIGEMPGKRFGYCYITDATGPNPWGGLPSYWEAEVAAVRRVNEGQGP